MMKDETNSMTQKQKHIIWLFAIISYCLMLIGGFWLVDIGEEVALPTILYSLGFVFSVIAMGEMAKHYKKHILGLLNKGNIAKK